MCCRGHAGWLRWITLFPLLLMATGCRLQIGRGTYPTRAVLAATLPSSGPAEGQFKSNTLPATNTPPPALMPRATATRWLTATMESGQVSEVRREALSPLPSCEKNGGFVSDSYFSSINNQEIRYVVYLPPCYRLDGHVYPALYLLHGNGQSEVIWQYLGIEEALNQGIGSGVLPAMLVIMPRGGWAMQHTSGGPGSIEDVMLNELAPLIEKAFCAWSDGAGRAIGGISRGGYWALEIAFRHPDYFASVGGHSAALLDIAAGPNLNPQVTGVERELGQLRVALDVGEEDVGSRPNLEQLHLDMVEAGVVHQWRLKPGGHDTTYWSTQLRGYLSWYGEPWLLDRSELPLCSLPPAAQEE